MCLRNFVTRAILVASNHRWPSPPLHPQHAAGGYRNEIVAPTAGPRIYVNAGDLCAGALLEWALPLGNGCAP